LQVEYRPRKRFDKIAAAEEFEKPAEATVTEYEEDVSRPMDPKSE
jgi:hypothetical protein